MIEVLTNSKQLNHILLRISISSRSEIFSVAKSMSSHQARELARQLIETANEVDLNPEEEL